MFLQLASIYLPIVRMCNCGCKWCVRYKRLIKKWLYNFYIFHIVTFLVIMFQWCWCKTVFKIDRTVPFDLGYIILFNHIILLLLLPLKKGLSQWKASWNQRQTLNEAIFTKQWMFISKQNMWWCTHVQLSVWDCTSGWFSTDVTPLISKFRAAISEFTAALTFRRSDWPFSCQEAGISANMGYRTVVMYTEIGCFVVCVAGWILVCSTMPIEIWTWSEVSGIVLTTSNYFSNLWKDCVSDSTGVSDCKGIPSLFALNCK